MPEVPCPIPGCEYVTPDVGDATGAALINGHMTSHAPPPHAAPPPRAPPANTRLEPVKRPIVKLEGTAAEWEYFLHRWEEYTMATKPIGPDRVQQLLECCDPDLRLGISRQAGHSMAEYTEEQALQSMKLLAMRAENIEVATDALLAMKQDRDEQIRSYATRVKGQAATCQLTEQCPDCHRDISFSDRLQRHVIIRGLADSQIRREMMQDLQGDRSLSQLIAAVESKEAGNRAHSHCLPTEPSSLDASSYRRQGKQTQPHRPQNAANVPTCTHCGGSHPLPRQSSCPAFGKSCAKCGTLNHYAQVCRKAQRSQPRRGRRGTGQEDTSSSHEVRDDRTPDSLSHAFVSAVKTSTPNSAKLEHLRYLPSSKTWVERTSKPQPYIKISLSTCRSDYRTIHHPLSKEGHTTTHAMADTGCQSCLMSVRTARALGLTPRDYLKARMRMSAANGNDIRILGAALVNLSLDDKGTRRTSKQMIYITDAVNKLFLSLEACVDIGLVPSDFPHHTECHALPDTTTPRVTRINLPDRTCDCLQRQLPPPLPSTLPFPATKENRAKLERYLLERYKSSTFNTCEHQPLPMMSGPPMRLLIDKDATPVAIHTPSDVPIHFQDKVKAGLERDVRLGVIERVPIGTPVTWCHRMVIAAKANGNPRRTIDFQSLNKVAARDTHHTMAPFLQARSVPPNTIKTVTDAWNGYHSVPLHPDDRHYTAFLTPYGRFQYKTTPQGYIASGDGYTRRFDEITSDFLDKTQCIDDTLLWAKDLTESFHTTAKWLDRCGRNGITLNPDKFCFGQETVEFAGFTITPTEVKPGPKFHTAIANFPTPTNITDVRSWFGLVNQVSYSFAMTETMLPFRELLAKNAQFKWTPALQAAMDLSKRFITQQIAIGVQIFDKSLQTCLATDWSKEGIGYWLFQKHCQCPKDRLFCCQQGWKIAMVGSRFTQAAESRYSAVEGESLALADALHKARHFVLGCADLIVAVDHKPLTRIFGDRSLEDIRNTRIRNLKEKTLSFRFRVVHIPGVRNRVADTLSRHPTGTKPDNHNQPQAVDNIYTHHPTVNIPNLLFDSIPLQPGIELEVEESTCASLIGAITASSITTWNEVQEATTACPDLQLLMDMVENGFPDSREEMPTAIRPYYHSRSDLSITEGVLSFRGRLVIPPPLRKACLKALHSAHHGTSAMTARAGQAIFWPGINVDIARTRDACSSCNRMAPSQAKLPPTPPVLATRPWQYLCADYFSYMGHRYLVIIDRYSGWPILCRQTHGSTTLIDQLRISFVTFGVPEELSSDGGPEFTSGQTQKFLKEWGIHHRLSSVAFPHSNCRAEIAVKSMKRLITNNIDSSGHLNTDAVQQAVLTFRNTPDPVTKLSPAQIIFGRQIRDLLPVLEGKYQPIPTWRAVTEHREATLRHRHAKSLDTWSEHSRRLPPLRIGDHVLIQNQAGNYPNKWDKTGVVVEVKQHHQYIIKVDGVGRCTLRNRQFLRRFTPHTPTLPPEQPIQLPTRAQDATKESHPRPPINTPHLDDPRHTPGDISGPPGLPHTHGDHPVPGAPTPEDTQPRPGQPPREPPLSPPTRTPSPDPTPPQIRRSTRTTKAPVWHKDYHMAVHSVQ